MAVIAKKKPEARSDAAATRAPILHAATEEFADKGYDGARVDEIAKQSDVNKNSLYHYFGSKEQLFVAVLERAYTTLRERQADLSIRGMAPAEGRSEEHPSELPPLMRTSHALSCLKKKTQ